MTLRGKDSRAWFRCHRNDNCLIVTSKSHQHVIPASVTVNDKLFGGYGLALHFTSCVLSDSLLGESPMETACSKTHNNVLFCYVLFFLTASFCLVRLVPPVPGGSVKPCYFTLNHKYLDKAVIADIAIEGKERTFE